MTAIIIPRCVQSKPYPGTQIDISHDLAMGMISCTLANEHAGMSFDILNPGRMQTVNSWAGTPRGMGAQGVNGNNVSIPRYILSTTARPPNVSLVTLVLMGPTIASNSTFASAQPTDASYTAWLLSHASGSDFVRVAWNNNAVTIIGATPLSIGQVVNAAFTFNKDAGILSLYREGRLDGSASATANAVRNLGIQGNVIAAQSGGIGSPYTLHTYLYNRILSSNEIAWITQEPYCMFLPVGARKFYSFGSSASARRLTSISM